MTGTFARSVANHCLFEFGATVETREAGLEAASLVRGEQSQLLLRLLVGAGSAGLTNNELSRQSGLRICAVTARVKELRCVEVAGGLLVELVEKRCDPVTGVINCAWRVNPEWANPSRGVVRDV